MNQDPISTSEAIKYRHEEEGVFLCEILDDISSLSERLRQHPDTLYELSYKGIAIDAFDPPMELGVSSHLIGQPAELSVGAINSYSHTAIDAISITPNDGADIEINSEHGLSHVRSGATSHYGDLSTLRSTLTNILPLEYQLLDPTDHQLLEYAKAKAPETQEVATLILDDDTTEITSTIRLTELETASDSIVSLDISLLRPHPSGKRVGTRLILTESLIRRADSNLASSDIERTVDVMAIGDDGFDELLLTSPLTQEDAATKFQINPATPYHMADVLDALDILKRVQL
jgi:hypothetical protein